MKGSKIISTLVALTMVMAAVVVINNLTDFKLVENTEAYPGIDAWEGNGTISTATNILNTSTDELYYNAEPSIQVNASTGYSWASGTNYYLYYPVYNNNNLTWVKYDDGGTTDIAPYITPNPASGSSKTTFGSDNL